MVEKGQHLLEAHKTTILDHAMQCQKQEILYPQIGENRLLKVVL